jgi:multidrug efflux pump subunit AcrB
MRTRLFLRTTEFLWQEGHTAHANAEEAIAEANGIRAMSSQSREQVSIITVEFNLSADLEAVANDVRDKVSKSRQQLPADIEPTIVEKSGPPDFLVFLTSSPPADTVIKGRWSRNLCLRSW